MTFTIVLERFAVSIAVVCKYDSTFGYTGHPDHGPLRVPGFAGTWSRVEPEPYQITFLTGSGLDEGATSIADTSIQVQREDHLGLMYNTRSITLPELSKCSHVARRCRYAMTGVLV